MAQKSAVSKTAIQVRLLAPPAQLSLLAAVFG